MKAVFFNMWKIGRWVLLTFLVLFIGLVIYRIPFVAEKERSDEVVVFINTQAITMKDVTGERLPPTPDLVINDSTIEGIDVNKNGIRDDVELAIFERYPDNIKVRAALLQYAMAIQMYLTEVFNSETWKVVELQQSRGYFCISDSLPQLDKEKATNSDWNDFFEKQDFFVDEVESLILDTNIRKEKYKEVFSKFTTSTGGSRGNNCDIDSGVFDN